MAKTINEVSPEEWDALTRKQKAEVLVDAVLNVPPIDEVDCTCYIYPEIPCEIHPSRGKVARLEMQDEQARNNQQKTALDVIREHARSLPPKGHDPVDKPNHYQVAGIEVRDIQRELSAAFTGQDASDFNNAVKYLLRSPKKGKLVEDLKKCRKHITWLIDSFGGDDAKG